MLNIDYVLEQFYTPTSKNYLEELLKNKHESLWFVLGKNECSLALISKIKINGLVDDFEENDKYWNELPILKSKDLPQGAIVINCSFSISPISANLLLKSLSGIKTFTYAELHQSNPVLFDLPNFVKECRLDLEINYEKYARLYDGFEDDESRCIFNQIISYRMTADISYQNKFSVRFKDQYFEPFLGDLQDTIFVDCGGYDGDTSEEFIKRYPKYKKIYFFEPSKINMLKAQKRLNNLRNIEFIELGVSDKSSLLHFDFSSGSSSKISNDGEVEISVIPLDDYLTKEPKTFIKMDLEGWELKALKGAEKEIKENKPILAIAVYHSISDFWKIPNLIYEFNPSYKTYLRHYTEGWSETVMYFV